MASRKGGGPDPSVPGKNDPPRRARRSSRASGPGFKNKPAFDRLAQLEHECSALAEVFEAAKKAEAWTATVQAAAKLAELHARTHAHRQSAEIATITDPVARLEAMLEQATADGSWGPAASIARQLDEVRARLAAEAAAEEEKRRRNATLSREKLIEAILSLPESARAQIRAALDAASGPAIVSN